ADRCPRLHNRFVPFSVMPSNGAGASPGLPRGFNHQRSTDFEGLPEGPTWKEVQRLLRTAKTPPSVALRTRAILMLFAVYGLRSGEVSRLQLKDFDWRRETFVVQHSKKGGSQQYPLQRATGDAI